MALSSAATGLIIAGSLVGAMLISFFLIFLCKKRRGVPRYRRLHQACQRKCCRSKRVGDELVGGMDPYEVELPRDSITRADATLLTTNGANRFSNSTLAERQLQYVMGNPREVVTGYSGPFPSGKWAGSYMDGPTSCAVVMDLLFFDGKVTGSGRDQVGLFVIEGHYRNNTRRACWEKRYLGKHSVEYSGKALMDKIRGRRVERDGRNVTNADFQLDLKEMIPRDQQPQPEALRLSMDDATFFARNAAQPGTPKSKRRISDVKANGAGAGDAGAAGVGGDGGEGRAPQDGAGVGAAETGAGVGGGAAEGGDKKDQGKDKKEKSKLSGYTAQAPAPRPSAAFFKALPRAYAPFVECNTALIPESELCFPPTAASLPPPPAYEDPTPPAFASAVVVPPPKLPTLSTAPKAQIPPLPREVKARTVGMGPGSSRQAALTEAPVLVFKRAPPPTPKRYRPGQVVPISGTDSPPIPARVSERQADRQPPPARATADGSGAPSTWPHAPQAASGRRQSSEGRGVGEGDGAIQLPPLVSSPDVGREVTSPARVIEDNAPASIAPPNTGMNGAS